LAVSEQSLHSIKAFSFSYPAHPIWHVGRRWARGWEGTHPGQLTPTDRKDITHHMPFCSAIKTQGREEEGGMFVVMMFVLPSKCYEC